MVFMQLIRKKVVIALSPSQFLIISGCQCFDVSCNTQLAEKFEAIIDAPMKALGCCCGQKPRFRPMSLYCFSSLACCIPVNAAYYSCQDKCVL